MKSVLISTRPKWCELIASGKKTIEVRKSKPKLETPFKCYIYCTKSKSYFARKHPSIDKAFGGGMVIGEFVCDVIYKTEPIEETQTVIRHYPRPWWYNGADDCLHHTELEDYLRWKVGYGWHISNLVIYDKPRELSEFSSGSSRLEFSNTEDGFPLKWSGMTRPPQSWCYVESEVQGDDN